MFNYGPASYLQVLNVGDGACAVLTSPWEMAHFIVDCGATSGGRGAASARILSDVLGRSSIAIKDVLITHFDADHWAGILHLPNFWTSTPVSSVTVRYPHLLPREQGGRTQAAHLLFQSALVGGSITPITDIIRAWRAKSVTVVPLAVKRGDRFRAGGLDWEVHWPPADTTVFTTATRDGFKVLASRIDELARSDKSFEQAVDAVYDDWLAAERIEDAGGQGYPPEHLEPLAAEVIVGLNLNETELEDIRAKLSSYANMLSVVHSSESVINFGDCEGAGLNALLRLQPTDKDLKSGYDVILAPHHGTQIPGVRTRSQFPVARWCLVSQNGPKHLTTAAGDPDIVNFKNTKSKKCHIDLHVHGHFCWRVD